jgi:coproporphyrinogen III oxidase
MAECTVWFYGQFLIPLQNISIYFLFSVISILCTIMNSTEQVASIYARFRKKICTVLENADGKARFTENRWKKEIGSGVTCVIQDGAVIERGGVNFSSVNGPFSPQMEKLLDEKANWYSATGISSIMHPVNPYVPIIHMNVRYFALDNGSRWFGGGIDITPHFIDIPEARAFHRELKLICDVYNPTFYPMFKKCADDYFFIPHRNETRGIGGIFFDRLRPDEKNSFNDLLHFTIDVANTYPVIYSHIIQQKSALSFTGAEKKWQQIRRGRYVEFNLVYDRGTKFGLESNGNTESILISLPANASWEFNNTPDVHSQEYFTLQWLKKGIDWINAGAG